MVGSVWGVRLLQVCLLASGAAWLRLRAPQSDHLRIAVDGADPIILPHGGGGPPDDVEGWGEFAALVACGSACGILRNASRPLALPRDMPVGVLDAPPTSIDYPRLAILATFAEYAREVPELATVGKLTVLSFSAGVELAFLRPRIVEECFYERSSTCDQHTLVRGSLHHAPFDFMLVSQTLEHLYDPPLALAQIAALLAPGGMVFFSVPAWNIEHMLPSHQQGLHPCGLLALVRGAGLEAVKLGWYGSEAYSHAVAQPGGSWPSGASMHAPDPFVSIPHDPRGYVNQAWVLARKPKAALEPPPPLAVGFGGVRPAVGFSDMQAASMAKVFAVNNAPATGTLLHLLLRNPAWLDGDVANVVLASAFFEQFELLNDNRFVVTAPVLAFGATARAVSSLLPPPLAAHVQVWTGQPTSEESTEDGIGVSSPSTIRMPRAPLAARGAFVTDLFESRSDPLGTLLEMFRDLAPGAPVFLACRASDVLNVSRPSLGTCTVDGLLQLVVRAGFPGPVEEWRLGRWGTVAYAHSALARGMHQSPRDLLCCSGLWVNHDFPCVRPSGLDPRLALVLCAPETGQPAPSALLTDLLVDASGAWHAARGITPRQGDAGAAAPVDQRASLERAIEPAVLDLVQAGHREGANWAAVAWVVVRAPAQTA